MSRNNKSIEEKARELSEPILEKAGFELWDVLFEKEGAMNYLRILFDKANNNESVTDDDCALMTAPLNEIMDGQDFIKQVDVLEIGSPGLTRRLRRPEHFEKSTGAKIRVMKRGDGGKTNVLYGALADFERETGRLTLKTDEETVILGVKNCLKINLEL